MNIFVSIFGLAKNNNGYFKSKKQSDFLRSQLRDSDGLIGHANSGWHTCPIFANWDEKGITQIFKHTKNGSSVMWERKEKNKLTSLEIKNLKSLERKAKALEKSINQHKESFENGTYGGYSPESIERYKYWQNKNLELLDKYKRQINDYKKQLN